jgi:hypothetical protein
MKDSLLDRLVLAHSRWRRRLFLRRMRAMRVLWSGASPNPRTVVRNYGPRPR